MGRSKKHTFISSFHLPKPGTCKANLQKILPLVLPCQQSLHGGLMQAWALESDRPGCKSQLGHLPALWPQRNFLISLIHFPHLKTVMTMTNYLPWDLAEITYILYENTWNIVVHLFLLKKPLWKDTFFHRPLNPSPGHTAFFPPEDLHALERNFPMFFS